VGIKNNYVRPFGAGLYGFRLALGDVVDLVFLLCFCLVMSGLVFLLCFFGVLDLVFLLWFCLMMCSVSAGNNR